MIKKKRMGRIFTLILILLLSFQFSVAQQDVKEHTIQKGETVYSISRMYGVSINAIYRLNPGSEDVIYVGGLLRIPDASSPSYSSDSDAIITDSKVINYKVKRGETKFSLAKRFGVSIAELERQNPHIRNILQSGHLINLDKTVSQKPTAKNTGEHIVSKGENLYRISLRYGITLSELRRANSDRLSEFLQVGQALIIPNKDDDVLTSGRYLVRPGDTKFSLAKRFNMSIPELEEKNPHIVKMLMAGQKLNIGNTYLASKNEEKTEEDTNSSKEKLAVTQPDKDKTDLASKNPVVKDPVVENSVTKENVVEDTKVKVVEALPDVIVDDTAVKEANNTAEPKKATETKNSIGETPTKIESTPTVSTTDRKYKDYVVEPKETLYSLARKAGMSTEALTVLNPSLLNSVNAGDVIKMPINLPKESESMIPSKNSALYAYLDTAETRGLYFYSPFSEKELSSPELREAMINENPDYAKYLEFFRGAQIAIDSALVLKLNFDISLIKDSDVKSTLDIESAYKKNALLVPFLESGTNFPKLKTNESFSVIDIESNINADNNTIYKPLPSEKYQQRKTLNYLATKDAQVLIVSDSEEIRNKDLITGIIPDAKFLKFDTTGLIRDEDLENALDKNRLNYVILDSERTIVFLNSTTTLMKKLRDFDIQLAIINTSLIPKKNEVSDLRYRVLKLIFPTYLNPENTESATRFEVNYEELFKNKPSKYASLGFDITLDTLLRLSQSTSFEDTINEISSEHIYMKFDYKKIDKSNYSNIGSFLMQYGANEGINKLD
jgi:LysM repeat protein